MLNNINISITTAFGLEAILKREIAQLGYQKPIISDGKIKISAKIMDIPILNINLRTAERVYWDILSFRADNFDVFFDKAVDFKWSDFIPANAKIVVTGKSHKSKLHSVPTLQSMLKKAIVVSLTNDYEIETLPENSSLYEIFFDINKDQVTISLNTTGSALHKRGYREQTGSAPIKETLAAALVLISMWKPKTILLDPCCGSGTILIEAAMIALNIAPGINRKFVSEKWKCIDSKYWHDSRKQAKTNIKDLELKLYGYDIDPLVLQSARKNITNAGLEDHIIIQKKDLLKIQLPSEKGFIITNPPYGERLNKDDIESIKNIYKTFGRILKNYSLWQLHIFTGYVDFQRYLPYKPSKNRKLYNGRLKCYFYQFFNTKKISNK